MTLSPLRAFLAILTLGVLSREANAQAPRAVSPDFAAFDRYVAAAAKTWHVPALAIAVVKNRQFIELCQRAGDEKTARLYREVIEPDERFHHEMGVRFLRELATDADSQELARAARLRTIELAEELQNLAYSRAKIHHAPGC